MKRRWRKLIPRAIVFLLLGAIVNVAVAWGCDGFAGCTTNDWTLHREVGAPGYPRATWKLFVCQAPGKTYYHSWRSPGSYSLPEEVRPLPQEVLPSWLREHISSWHEIEELLNSRNPGLPQMLAAEARGWPLRSLWCEFVTTDPGKNGVFFATSGGIELPLSPTPKGPYQDLHPRTLPLRSLWPGFAINTIFYATIIALLWFTPGMIRRRVRIRRGRCPACGYQLASGTGRVCSECGAAVPG